MDGFHREDPPGICLPQPGKELEGLLHILIQTGSELTKGQWPTLLNAEAKSHNIFATYGMPDLWEMVSHDCNETSCALIAHVPRLNEAIRYPVVKLTGLGEIIQNTLIVPWDINGQSFGTKPNGITFPYQIAN